MATASHNSVFPPAGPSSEPAHMEGRDATRWSRGGPTLRGRARGRSRRMDMAGTRGIGSHSVSGVDDDVGMAEPGGGAPYKTDKWAARISQPFKRGIHKRGTGPRAQSGAPHTISIRGTSSAKAAIIEAANQNMNKSSGSAIATLQRLLEARYNSSIKLLDLSNLRSDPILAEANVKPPGTKGASHRFAAALWKLCATHIPDVQSISLANNNIRIPAPFAPSIMACELPNLRALSLADNLIPELALLNSYSANVGHEPSPDRPGLKELRELVLSGNPFVKLAVENDEAGKSIYVAEVVRRFPTLESLDGFPIDPGLRHNLPAPARLSHSSVRTQLPLSQPPGARTNDAPEPALPLAIKSGLFDSPVTASVVASFLSRFFSSYDNQRDALVDVYGTDAIFTLDAIEIPAPRTKALGKAKSSREMPAQQALDRYLYRDYSRNLKWNKSAGRRHDRMHRGQTDIVKFINTLPRTKHPISQSEDQKLFVVDAWQMHSVAGQGEAGTVLFVNVHGQFQEMPSSGVRSFDRTFVLGAASPSSAAALKGWPCVILNDRLQIRPYAPASCFEPAPASNDTTVVCNPSSALSSLTQDQQNLVTRLMQATKLNTPTAIDCLQQNAWDATRAMANFQELHSKGAIPATSFVS